MSPDDVDDSDEDYGEKTRIEVAPTGGMVAPTASPRPGASASHSSTAEKVVPIKPAATAKPRSADTSQSANKLRALESLSRSSDSSKSYSQRPERRGGGGMSWLPWTLLTLCGAFFAVTQVPQLSKVAKLLHLENALRGGTATPTTPVVPAGAEGLKIETVRPAVAEGQSLRAAGYIAARIPITVGSTLPGRVKYLKVTEGDKVKRNQVLAQLDDSQDRAALRLSVAKQRDAHRTLARTKALVQAQGATEADLDRAVGLADISHAEAGTIVDRISQAVIRSPIDGTILEVVAHPGEVVGVNAGVVKMADLANKLIAEVDVNQPDLPLVHMEQKVDLISEAFPDRHYEGVVKEFAEQADRARGTVQVKVSLQAPDGSLRPGMSVKVSFLPGKGEKPLILIPAKAMDDAAVWLVGKDGTVSRQPVMTRAGPGTTLVVVEGLVGGERIVVERRGPLKPGQKVE